MTFRFLAGAAALALASPASAQEHDHHSAQPAEEPQHAEHAEKSDYCIVSLEGAEMTCEEVAQPPVDHSQMDHAAMGHGAWEYDTAGEGSGTARLPPNEGMDHGAMIGLGGDAALMLHGFVWPVYTDQGGPRGDDKLYVQSMAMATVSGTFDGGRYMARTMLSAEPLMRHDGYPNLFASGEVAYGEPLVDRQHPHDLVMELAARVDLDVSQRTSVFLYGGPVGEPALGPSAFMHRASARYNPEAPITHHWFDSTHITYGVVTAGVSAPTWQLEASAFRGREPDEFRWNIETPRLDSWSVRGSFSPASAWLVQASYGQIDEPEALHPGEDEHRTTASAHYNDGRGLSAMVAFSAKNRQPGDTLTAWLGEVNWDIDRHHTLFGRVENVKSDELFHDHDHPLHDQAFRVTKFQAGYAYRLPVGPVNLALGGSLAMFAKPDVLDAYYGSHPIGYTLFARFSLEIRMRYFEDVEVGARASFGRYEVTREEVIDFASKYDPQPFHLDDEAAAKTYFGRLSASGWHTCAMTMAMLVENMKGSEQAGLGSPGVDSLRWLKPVYPGDTLRCETELKEKRRSRSRPEMGSFKSTVRVFNQHDEQVLELQSIGLIRVRDPQVPPED